MISKISTFILLLLLVSTSIAPINAVGLLATPAKIKYNIKPLQNVAGEITVLNIGKVPMNVTIQNKKLLMDTIHLLYSDNGIATWITPQLQNFTLKPHETKKSPSRSKLPTISITLMLKAY